VPGLAGRRGLPWRCHPHHDCSHQDPHPNSLTDHHFPRYREARRRVILIRAPRVPVPRGLTGNHGQTTVRISLTVNEKIRRSRPVMGRTFARRGLRVRVPSSPHRIRFLRSDLRLCTQSNPLARNVSERVFAVQGLFLCFSPVRCGLVGLVLFRSAGRRPQFVVGDAVVGEVKQAEDTRDVLVGRCCGARVGGAAPR
jgi:hypothetical protein